MNIRILFSILTLSLALTPAFAQRGDRGNEKQPEVWKELDVPPAPVVPPDKALSTFRVAPGFKLELVAAEPLVEDPVAIAWDEDGRLWAVEMRGYMPNVDGKGEDVRNGQIVVLEDTDGDGSMDKSTVFLDKLQMPRALAHVQGGVLVAEPSKLWYCRDTDGDLKCDQKTEVYQGYGRQGPVEHTDNGLLRGFDQWLYNAKSSTRLKFIINEEGKPKVIDDRTHGRGQWGITQDNFGRLFYNSNSSYLSADRIIGEYGSRNPHHDARFGGQGVASDQDVWSIRVNPGINRGYQGHMLRDDGRLRRTTATCGPGVYRGDQFPAEYDGDVFVPEPSGNVVAHLRIEENEGRVRGQHMVYDDPDWEKREFLACTDERFRPVNAYTGPDGCLYIVDMYRGILQHKVYVTSFLRKQILERMLDKPVGLGRIYRVVYVGDGAVEPSLPPRMSKDSAAELVKHLAHPNGWWRDMAQRLLIERNDDSVVGDLEAMATTHDSPFARLHALWTLAGMEYLDPYIMGEAVADEHPRVRAAAIRLCEPLLQSVSLDPIVQQEQQQLVDALVANANHESEEVQRQLAFTLGTIKGPGVGDATRKLLLRHASDGDVRDGVITGLHQRELEFLQRLLSDKAWVKPGGGRDDLIEDLAACVVRENSKPRIARLLALAADQDAPATKWRAKAILDGVAKVAFPKGRKPKPLYYDTQPRGLATLLKHDDKQVREQAEQVGEFIKFGEAPPPLPPPTPLTAAQQKLFNAGKVVYANTCASCHLDTGLGEDGKAPPLIDSPWLLESKAIPIRIILHGMTGEIEVHGRTYNLEMPPVQGLSDEQLAAVLTYARREWDHRADPIEPDEVAKQRELTKDRERGWTAKELWKLKE